MLGDFIATFLGGVLLGAVCGVVFLVIVLRTDDYSQF